MSPVNMRNPHPLSLDRVMEGIAPAALNSPLFQIPTEILTMIVRNLSTNTEALASLALVNSACRQLSRSCQFCTLTLDSSPRSESIVGALQREAIEIRQNYGQIRSSLSLGACIRRVVTNNKGYWSQVHAARPRKPERSVDDESEDSWLDESVDTEGRVEQWRSFVHNLTAKLSDTYRPNVNFVISSLIHLESLEIGIGASLDQLLLNTIMASPIRQLSMHDLTLTEVVPSIDESIVWPLETLYIRMQWSEELTRELSGTRLDASKHWQNILRPCSAHLRILVLSHHTSHTLEVELADDDISFTLQFPRLQKLDIRWEECLAESTLRSLILTSPVLSSLAIDYGHQPTRTFLDREGHIDSLETLVLNAGRISGDFSFQLLKKNRQLKALAFTALFGWTAMLLERALKELRNFSQLTMLSIGWAGVSIPSSSLEKLSCLSSLQSLHLSSGVQAGWRHDWPVCHETVISHIKPLRNLRKIAFTRDMYSYVYPGDAVPSEYEDYASLLLEQWDLHMRTMRAQALSYAQELPDLEFIHLGHISFHITRAGKEIDMMAEEVENYKFLEDMLGYLSGAHKNGLIPFQPFAL